MSLDRNKMLIYLVYRVETKECYCFTDYDKAKDKFFNTKALDGKGFIITSYTCDGDLVNRL